MVFIIDKVFLLPRAEPFNFNQSVYSNSISNPLFIPLREMVRMHSEAEAIVEELAVKVEPTVGE